MIYDNYSQNSILEMEKHKTDNYGFDMSEPAVFCDECRISDGDFYEFNSEILCSDCMCDLVREKIATVKYEDEDSQFHELICDIMSDFSDNELLYYIENIFKKINA